MKLKDLGNQIALGEDSSRQFKVDVKNAESLASEMAAFANSDGGTIFIGVADDGSTPGLSGQDVARINQLISNAASQLVRSPLTVQTENVALGKRPHRHRADRAQGDRQALFRQERGDLAQDRGRQAAGELQGRAAPPVPVHRSVSRRRTAHQGRHRQAGQAALPRFPARCLQAGVSRFARTS